MKRRKMSALQKKYFGKRKVRHSVRRKKVVMTKRRSYRSRVRSYARKGTGGLKSMVIPVGAGLLDRIIDNYTPIDGIGSVAIGIIGHNEWVKNNGLYKVGYTLGNVLPIPFISNTQGGGF